MTYIVCGLQGSLKKYESLKKQAGITENDTVYPLGGLADGDLSLLCELSMSPNAYPVMGKSDWVALRMLGGFEKMLKSGGEPDAKYIRDMKKWVAEGGQSALDSFRGFDADMKEGVLDYLGDFALFEEANVKGHDYILLSAGIKKYSTACDVYELEPADFISESLDMEKEYFAGKIVITASAENNYDKITRVGNNICVGCGKAVCLRLEDMAEFYE